MDIAPDHGSPLEGSPSRASLFRAGVGLRLAGAAGLSALVWLAIAWARGA